MRNRGMTLVEVLVASVIVGIIAVGMLGIFVVSRKTAHKSGDKIVALNDARTKILEEVTGKDYNFVDVGKNAMENYDGLAIVSGSYGTLIEEEWDIVIDETTLPVYNISYPYKQVDFEVSWTGR